MIKQYFADGMISVAIILSLLRTDIHQYLNNSLINYPEIHDIILGTSTAYIQTNFHNNYINSIGGISLHPKNIENEYLASSILGELRSFSRFRRFHGLNTNINAFLVNPPASIVPHATNAETENIPVNPSESSSSDSVEPSSLPSEDVNNNLSSSNTSVAQLNSSDASLLDSTDNFEDLNGAFSLHPMHNVLTDAFSNSTVTAANLTNEDLDLIETLWRQDIDLGIGKEVFDLNLRRELEREREVELQKQRDKQKELELLQYKLEEERRQQAQTWIAQNYVQDGETGEWIAVNSSTPDLNGNNTGQDQEWSFEEAFRILDGVAPLSNGTITDLDEYMGNVTTDVNTSYLQNVSSEQAQIDQLIETAQSFNQSEINEGSGGVIQRQVSLEQHWQDLVSVLNLSHTHNAVLEPMDTAEPSPVTTLPPEDTSVLLQNATMPQPILNTSTPLQSFSNTSFMPPADVYTNTSGHSTDVTSPVVWNTGDMLFPNLTSSMNHSDALNSVDDILPDLLGGSELENITLDVDDMDLTDSLQCLQMADEVSSDSAVSSMDSMASPVNDFNETSTLGSMSPYDGVEGATGGSEYASSGDSKLGKYDPEDYNYSYSPYDTGDYNDQSNYSSSSNDTHHFQTPDLNQVQHNHTYPLQPGSQPKESKTSSSRQRQKGPHSRDEKRAREMKLPISVESIIRAPVDEFNELLSKHKMTEPQLQLVRDIRRRGKNKVAAQNCRKRKLDSIFTLEDELNNLKEIKDRLLRERYMIDKETREMKGKFHHLYQEVFQSLRDEHGQPYDPNEFSLQETSDGNVFLVPRNGTANHSRKDFNRKRKDKR